MGRDAHWLIVSIYGVAGSRRAADIWTYKSLIEKVKLRTDARPDNDVVYPKAEMLYTSQKTMRERETGVYDSYHHS